MTETKRVDAADHVPEVREPAGYRRTDADLRRELAECLADDVALDASGIEIEVRHGEVTISGAVRHVADMRRAEAHACALTGVTLVHNALQPREAPPVTKVEAGPGAAAKMGKPGYER
jgi:osmotically-inducible protein OsmY